MEETQCIHLWINTTQASELCDYTARYIRMLAQTGKIHTQRANKRCWLIYWPSLRDYKPDSLRWPNKTQAQTKKGESDND